MKKLVHLSILSLLLYSFTSCKKNKPDNVVSTTEMYFPSTSNNVWESVTPSSLNWDNSQLEQLYPYLSSKNTKAFIVLKNGKIVVEKYFGTFTVDSNWYWASAGKTFTAFMVGIAQNEGIVNINNKTSDYLGKGWTSEPLIKENLITIKNQLNMTTGLDDNVPNNDCTLATCLVYKADASTRWAYHTAPYTLLDKVIENASGMSYNNYCSLKVKDKIGMNGLWIKTPDANNIFYSTARSMAKFGLLLLNKGKWNNDYILKDSVYFKNQINSSQDLNPSYGYLTWLNGKSSHILPGSQIVFTGSLIPNAPVDLYAALGKNDQKIYVVPSQNLVIIRMGNSAGSSLAALSSFDNELWGKLKTIIKY